MPANLPLPDMATLSDYVTVFVMKKSVFSSQLAMQGVKEFFALNFEPSYYTMNTSEHIAQHAYGYLCAKVAPTEEFGYSLEKDDGAFYFCRNNGPCMIRTEQRMEQHYLSRLQNEDTHGMSVRTYRARDAAADATGGLWLYVLERNPFCSPGTKSTDFEQLTTERFVHSRHPKAQERYKMSLRRLREAFMPGVHTIEQLSEEDGGGQMLQIAFKPDRVAYLVGMTSLLLTMPHIMVTKKFLETFANGAQVYTFYMKNASEQELVSTASNVGQLPNRKVQQPLMDMFHARTLTAHQSIYATSVVMFAYYFSPPTISDEFTELSRALQHNEAGRHKLKKMRDDMFRELMSEEHISNVLAKHRAVLLDLYDDFAKGPTQASTAALRKKVAMSVENANEREILDTCVTFNAACKKTNFFSTRKAAIAYRLDPAFIKKLDYPRVPYAVYFIVGAHFRGFHIRFGDIARGGVRIIRSRGATFADRQVAYRRNKASLFNENYNLAYTQMLKNKDIPESGSKGTLLVSIRSDTSDRALYMQYIDAILDVTLPSCEGVRDSLKRDEILFLGPDEGTAGSFPSMAAKHSKERGLAHWKSFTTGKLPDIGGIPHDTYGMTTQSVRQYCLGIYDKLHLSESALTKFMTGGPDGDLGSNEIKMGHERVVAICDGFASVHDPDGIDRAELLRLAHARLSLKEFDKSKLTANGFWVGVTEKNVVLPDGMVVKDGTQFRNTFHFSRYADADLFVPCGGRPASVALETVAKMLRSAPSVTADRMLTERDVVTHDKLRFKYIVEGANLFFTQDARLALENCGVHFFKDSSTNKGGVTSSSLEVLTGLALTDEEHLKHMSVVEGRPTPQFYEQLVEEIGTRIRNNARREFNCLWADVEKGFCESKKTLVSDALSQKINDIKTFIQDSEMHQDEELYTYVLRQYVPETIQALVPIEEVMRRVPENYMRACFAMYIASSFVYETGMAANEFSFFQFMRKLNAAASHGRRPSKL